MNGRGVEVYVIKPQDFAEAQTAADLLKEGRTVVINLEGVELTVDLKSEIMNENTISPQLK